MSLMISKGREQVFNYLHAQRICVRCRRKYTERDNLGQWKCPRYHPQENGLRGSHGEYTCCGRRVGSIGCVSADHTDSVATPMHDFERLNRLTFEPDAFALLGDTRDDILYDSWHDTGSEWVVDRIDIAGAKRRLNPLTRVQPEIPKARYQPLDRDY